MFDEDATRALLRQADLTFLANSSDVSSVVKLIEKASESDKSDSPRDVVQHRQFFRLHLHNLVNRHTEVSSFACRNRTITTIDFSNCPSVTKIGDNFLTQCPALTSVNLDGFVNVEEIGSMFLGRCAMLPSLDLSRAFGNVKSIGGNFLCNCMSLKSVKFSSSSSSSGVGGSGSSGCFSKLDHFGAFFLAGCTNLESLDCSGNIFQSVTTVGSSFCFQCRDMTNIDLRSSFPKCRVVLDDFLRSCIRLEALDLTGAFPSLQQMDPRFANELRSATRVVLDNAFGQLTRISDDFLVGCEALKSLDLSKNVFPKVESVGCRFLNEATALRSLNLDGAFPELRTIEKSFLRHCSSLTSLDFSRNGAFAKLKHITSTVNNIVVAHGGSTFLCGLRSLTNLNLDGLHGVVPPAVGDGDGDRDGWGQTWLRTIQNPGHDGTITTLKRLVVSKPPQLVKTKRDNNNKQEEAHDDDEDSAAAAEEKKKNAEIVRSSVRFIERSCHLEYAVLAPVIIQALPKKCHARKVALWTMRKAALLIRHKARPPGRWGELFQIWNVMTTTAQFLA